MGADRCLDDAFAELLCQPFEVADVRNKLSVDLPGKWGCTVLVRNGTVVVHKMLF